MTNIFKMRLDRNKVIRIWNNHGEWTVSVMRPNSIIFKSARFDNAADATDWARFQRDKFYDLAIIERETPNGGFAPIP